MTNYYNKREELGPSGFSTVINRSSRSQFVQKSSSMSQFNDLKNSIHSSLPPLPNGNISHRSLRRTLNEDYAKPPPLPPLTSASRRSKYGLDIPEEPVSRPSSRRPSLTDNQTTNLSSLSRRPSIKSRPVSSASNYDYNRAPRPFSTSYTMTPSASTRASPVRELYSSGGSRSRRNSVSKLPWPEPSPMRELPPSPPRPKIKHYPLPPPSYAEGMIAVSRRLRNRSSSPAPSYSELELSSRPAIISAAIGRPSPSRDMIRMTLCGPPLRQYHYGKAY